MYVSLLALSSRLFFLFFFLFFFSFFQHCSICEIFGSHYFGCTRTQLCCTGIVVSKGFGVGGGGG